MWTPHPLRRACRCRRVAGPAAVYRRSPTRGSSTAAPRRPNTAVETSIPLPSRRAVTSPAQGACRDAIQGRSSPSPLPSRPPSRREDFSSPNCLPAPIKSPARLPTSPRTATTVPLSFLSTRAPPPPSVAASSRAPRKSRLHGPSPTKVSDGVGRPRRPFILSHPLAVAVARAAGEHPRRSAARSVSSPLPFFVEGKKEGERPLLHRALCLFSFFH
jgi:hypothetical protein